MNSSCSGGMPHASAAARASVARISPLILSSVLGCPAGPASSCRRNLYDPLLDRARCCSSVDAEQAVELDHEVGEPPGVVVEDGDVAAGHVGDVDVVPLLDQADERAAHADDVVVGMRAEDEDACFGRSRRRAGLRADRCAIISSNTRRPSRSAGPCSRSSSYSSCSRKSSSESFSSPLLHLQAQPDDGPADQLRRPVDRPELPRPLDGGQLGRRRPASRRNGRVGVLLQEAGGDRVGRRPLDGLVHDRRLVLAEGQQDDLAGVEDGADAHRQGLVRHVLLAEEAAGGVAARHRVERDQARAAVARSSRAR